MTTWNFLKERDGVSLGIRISKVIQSADDRSHVSVFETIGFSRILTSGNSILLTDRKEDPYHEMLVLPALDLLPSPASVLVVGGSDGGTIQMLLRSPKIESITVAGADPVIVASARSWFAASESAFSDARVRFSPVPAAEFVRDCRIRFDLIVVDTTEATTAPAPTQSFFCDCFRILTADGAIVLDCGCHHDDTLRRELAVRASKLKNLFPHFRLYAAPAIIAQLPGRMIAIATKSFDPARPLPSHNNQPSVKGSYYYNREVRSAAFVLPEYLAADCTRT